MGQLKVTRRRACFGWKGDRSGVRLETVPAVRARSPKIISGAVQRQDHLHVNVQRHCMGRKGNTERCEYDSLTVANYARRFPRGRWSFLGHGSEKKWYGTHSEKPDGAWDKTAEQMMMNFAETSHPIFRASSAFERGEAKWKGKSIHFNGSEENIEYILRTIISPNQLSVYGAVADLCRELSKDSRASEKLDAPEYLETMEIPTEPSICWPSYRRKAAGKPGAILWAQIRTTIWRPEVIQTMLWRWFEDCRKRTILHHTWYRRMTKCDGTSMPRIYNASKRKGDSSERVDSQEYENRPSLGR